MHLAAFFGHSKILLLLIKFGANVNVANSSGYTPLHMACQSNRYEVLEILLKANANPTIRNHISRLVVSKMTQNLFVLYSKTIGPQKFEKKNPTLFLKFSYSEEATKISPIFHFLFDIT